MSATLFGQAAATDLCDQRDVQRAAEVEELRRAALVRRAQHLKRRAGGCPVYYLDPEGRTLEADDAPPARPRKLLCATARPTRWRLVARKVYGPTDDGLCEGEWELRDLWERY